MKIIFLDFDGVLNSVKYERQLKEKALESSIDETRLDLLNELVNKTGAKIVLTTSWKRHWERNEKDCDQTGLYINSVFKRHGLEIYDKTQDLGDILRRREEVSLWLKENKVSKYVIIDDYGFGWEEHTPYLVKTSMQIGYGLERRHIDSAIEILNK